MRFAWQVWRKWKRTFVLMNLYIYIYIYIYIYNSVIQYPHRADLNREGGRWKTPEKPALAVRKFLWPHTPPTNIWLPDSPFCNPVDYFERETNKTLFRGRSPRGVMDKAMDCVIVVSEFELQTRYLPSLSDKYPWERYKSLIFPAMGEITSLLFFYKKDFGIK